ncbi:MAG TPA: succinylglutamate desuccinylase/aspartoacylase family protein [Acetobacteraceae bacterium]|nr:succinylglutamate desuccinylase/aspartoacylase family protein [Acetobacteraceae bacterium]
MSAPGNLPPERQADWLEEPLPPPPLPEFQVHLAAPDLGPWVAGNTGIRGFTSLASGTAGPHIVLIALTHGNEIAGAIALDRLLRAGLRPARGRLTLGFANLAAFARFDPEEPTASRFVDEDLNRLWDPFLLDGQRHSCELDRAREMRPLIDQADVLLDLHSMLWPSEPLLLSGPSAKGLALARGIGLPPLIVADQGHMSGPRLIDYGPFVDPASRQAAALVEAGQHWLPETVETTLACIDRLLRFTGLRAETAPPAPSAALPERPPRYAEVTMAVTAMSNDFTFVHPVRGGEVIPRRDTLIAVDGKTEIRTPHDDCLLVMPSLRPCRGHTAVRLARFL